VRLADLRTAGFGFGWMLGLSREWEGAAAKCPDLPRNVQSEPASQPPGMSLVELARLGATGK
jgi:hypothetical protein